MRRVQIRTPGCGANEDVVLLSFCREKNFRLAHGVVYGNFHFTCGEEQVEWVQKYLDFFRRDYIIY